MPLDVLPLPVPHRWPRSLKETHASAARAIAQAAVNVELFTIPLYMASMYSIQGTHQITGNNNFYAGRKWPGLAPTAGTPDHPLTANAWAFNVIFSVFVQEMLHLQMAANIAVAIGVAPTFTSSLLQTDDHAWKCYGADKTEIPHIVDLRDTRDHKRLKVNIAELSPDQIELFMVIEQTEAEGRAQLEEFVLPSGGSKYFPEVPFEGWTVSKNEVDLPWFGTIGHMYQCYLDYLKLTYDDGTTLWDYLTPSFQNDMFNFKSKNHPRAEFPRFEAALTNSSVSDEAFAKVVDMMHAITDQGEGNLLIEVAPTAVEERYRPDREALEADYPSYDDQGHRLPGEQSAHAAARFDNGGDDHYERFARLSKPLEDGDVTTWPQWFESGERWTPRDLKVVDGPDPETKYRLPPTAAVADALNTMGDPKGPSFAANYRMMSQAAVGALAGVTTVLNDYWSKPRVQFPFPSMAGSGDRMSICWAVFGKAPDLSIGIGAIDPAKLHHACQGLDFASPGNDCAAIEVFHSCRGSNACRAQGGCGFVQSVNGGGQCGASTFAAKIVGDPGAATGDEPVFSAPSDNKCGGFGGCAVPISASQVFPGPIKPPSEEPSESGTMELFEFEGAEHHSKSIGTMPYDRGEMVHDVAYRAYQIVMKRGEHSALDEAPKPNIRRLVFPPST